ncbi:hypothetical protein [Fusibacter ferrireducens]|nr:hypothetical protein [Fusibacter ferrireducens]
MKKASESAKAIKKMTRNKRACQYLSVSEQDDFFYHQLQIADLHMALSFNFLKAAEVFDLDLTRVQKELVMKYKDRRCYAEE